MTRPTPDSITQRAWNRLHGHQAACFVTLVDNERPLLVRNGEILEDNLDRSAVSMKDLRAKIREANALSVDAVEAVVFETTGDISVLHSSDPDESVADWLLEDVRQTPPE